MIDLIIANVRLPDGAADESFDIGIGGGRIVAIEPRLAAEARIHDARGRLARSQLGRHVLLLLT